ncbi:MAG: hypothetical protein KA795_08745 [Burkholderiaceae bacterium]|nr:hypothetical protein [Burkholderiaceae bacterium]
MTTTAAPTRTVQMRTYQLAPELADAFVAWWQGTMPALRARFGFRIPFAWHDRDNALFIWGLEVDGDREAFLAAEQAYNDSPERRALKLPDAAMVKSITSGFAQDALRR